MSHLLPTITKIQLYLDSSFVCILPKWGILISHNHFSCFAEMGPLSLFSPTILIPNHYFFTLLFKLSLCLKLPYELSQECSLPTSPFHSLIHFNSWLTVFLKFYLYVKGIQSSFKQCVQHSGFLHSWNSQLWWTSSLLSFSSLFLWPKIVLFQFQELQ